MKRGFSGCLFLVTWIFVAPASAQVLFSDDFESGTLRKSDVPAGRWGSTVSAADQTLTASGLAAHRGAFGMRVNVTAGAAGTKLGVVVRENIAQQTSSLYGRYWLRISFTTNAGAFYWMAATGPAQPGPKPAMINVGMGTSSPHYILGGWDTPGNIFSFNDLTPFVADTWHLVEFSMSGLGTAAGRRELWIDGSLAGTQTGVDWTGGSANNWSLGLPYMDNALFTGSLHFDDARLSSSPPASTLSMTAGASLHSGDCVPVTVQLRDSMVAALAPASEDLSLQLSTTGAGAFFASAACSDPIPSIGLPTGASEVNLFYRGTEEGLHTLRAASIDYLNTPLALTLEAPVVIPPDPEPEPEPTPVTPGEPGPEESLPLALQVGCGCAEVTGSVLWPGSLLLWLLRRRRAQPSLPKRS